MIEKEIKSKLKNRKVAVLYSGGLDSFITVELLHYLGAKILLLHFDYGQKANKAEMKIARDYAEYRNFELKIVNIKSVFEPFSNFSTLLRKNSKDSSLKEAESDSNYVPMRNLILLSYAGAFCEIMNIDILAYGANLTESGNYPDNSLRFFMNLRETLKTSGKQNYKLQLLAPLINFTKTEIVYLGAYLGTPFNYSLSCYYPKIVDGKIIPCNKCGSCLLRINAFKRANIPDTNLKERVLNEKTIEIYNLVIKQLNQTL